MPLPLRAPAPCPPLARSSTGGLTLSALMLVLCTADAAAAAAGVFEGDAAWPAIQGFAQSMGQLSGSALPAAACPASAARLGPAAAPDCVSSREGGRPGTGYEGPTCQIDINECARGTSNCDPNAACLNTPGAFTCTCYEGYVGDGTTCAPVPATLLAVQQRYTTGGPGQLACSEGRNVTYPLAAPGYQYDPIGALNSEASFPLEGAKEACAVGSGSSSSSNNKLLIKPS